MNGVTICSTKYLDIASLKVLQTSCLSYNPEEKSIKFPNPEMNLIKIDTSFPVQVL